MSRLEILYINDIKQKVEERKAKIMEKSEGKKPIPVSPINGQPLPRGNRFTSETAREAQRKRSENARAKKSITSAFLKLMHETVTVDKNGREYTGAEAIARSIIQGAMKGSGEMVKIALALTGETPTAKVKIEAGKLAELIDGLKEPCDDLHEETAGIDGAVEDE